MGTSDERLGTMNHRIIHFVSAHTWQCRRKYGDNCSRRVISALDARVGLLTLALVFGQTLLCCGNPHRQMPQKGAYRGASRSRPRAN